MWIFNGCVKEVLVDKLVFIRTLISILSILSLKRQFGGSSDTDSQGLIL